MNHGRYRRTTALWPPTGGTASSICRIAARIVVVRWIVVTAQVLGREKRAARHADDGQWINTRRKSPSGVPTSARCHFEAETRDKVLHSELPQSTHSGHSHCPKADLQRINLARGHRAPVRHSADALIMPRLDTRSACAHRFAVEWVPIRCAAGSRPSAAESPPQASITCRGMNCRNLYASWIKRSSEHKMV
jgi:hypothetical protein